VTGITSSSDFPTTAGAFQTTFAGAFVTKLNPNRFWTGLLHLLGGSGRENGYGIAVDTSGNAYVTGLTYSTTSDDAGAIPDNSSEVVCTVVANAFVTKLDAPAPLSSTPPTSAGGAMTRAPRSPCNTQTLT